MSGAGNGDGATVALTYREIADRLGLNLPAAKARVRRRDWKKIEPNDQTKPLRFLVPLAALEAERRGAADEVEDDVGEGEDATAVSTLRDHLARLDARLDRQAEEHAREVARMREEHAAALDRERRDRAEDMARLREDRDREVERLAALVERLATPAPGLIERVVNAIKGRKP